MTLIRLHMNEGLNPALGTVVRGPSLRPIGLCACLVKVPSF